MGEREYIAGKRSGIRRRANGPEKSNKDLITGAVIITIVFVLIFSAYSATNKISNVPEKAVAQEPAQKPVSTPEQTAEVQAGPEVTPLSDSKSEEKMSGDIPAPNITIHSPENVTINESTPLLDVYVEGEEIDRVWVSIDGGSNVTMSHSNGSIGYVRLKPILADDFSSSTSKWKTNENWRIINGSYESSYTGDIYLKSKIYVGASDFLMESKVTPLKYRDVSREARIGLIGQKNPAGDIDDWCLILYSDDGEKKLGILEELSGGWYVEDFNWDVKKNYIMKLQVKGNQMKGSIWEAQSPEPEWMITTDLINKLPSAGYAALYAGGAQVRFDDIIIYQPLSNGQHHIRLYAKNAAGNISSVDRYFTVNSTTDLTENLPSVGDTITKNGLAVTLNRYAPVKELESGSFFGLYGIAYITIENVGKIEKNIKFDTSTVLLDDIGNQYLFKKLNYDDEIIQGTLYPTGKKSGALYFSPSVYIGAKKVKLIIKSGGEKYEFDLKAF